MVINLLFVSLTERYPNSSQQLERPCREKKKKKKRRKIEKWRKKIKETEEKKEKWKTRSKFNV